MILPELPEVETIVRELRKWALKREIKQAKLLRADMLKNSNLPPAGFARFFRNSRFQSVTRRGKFILFTLDNGDRLLVHLGMTGKFVVSPRGGRYPTHLCSQYFFENGDRLDHADVRRLGRLELHHAGETIPSLGRLGIDPLSSNFDADSLRVLLFARDGRTPRKRAIHTLLLDQSLISGIGNIYASEALFRAWIRPDKSGGKLKTGDCGRLAEGLRNVLKDALQFGGTTVSDYRRVNDEPGSFVSMLQVYGRAGEPCRQCGATIQRLRLGGRSAYFCPECQKMNWRGKNPRPTKYSI